MQGQQSREYQNLRPPNRVNVDRVNAPAPLSLPRQSAGPNLNLPNLSALPAFNFQRQQAAPSLGEATYKNDYRYQDVAAGPQARAQTITPDLGYKYNPFTSNAIAANTGQVNNTYNYTPDKVRTTMNNKDFTQNYFQQGVMNPLLRQYDTAIAPRLADTAAAAGNTFSTRAKVSQQMALQDLQTQALGELSRVVREDELTRSAQDLQAQQFNVGTATQNKQFGANQQLSYDTLNSQRALQIALANEANRMGAHQMNTEGRFNEFAQRNQNILQAGSLNNQFGLQAHQLNNQDRQFVQGLNAQGRENQARMANDLATQFAQINTQRGIANQQNAFNFANLNTQGALNAFNANLQNALGFGNLNTQRQLGAAQLNNQNNQFFAGLNQQGALDAYRLNSANALGFGQLNTSNQLQSQIANNQSQQNYDFFNQQMQTQLAESAANRQLQANELVGNQINSMYNQYGMMGQLGNMMQGLDQQALNRNYQDFLRMAPENSPWLQLGMQLLGQNQGNVAVNRPGVGDQIAGGLGLTQAGLSMLPVMGGLGTALFGGAPVAGPAGVQVAAAGAPVTAGLLGGLGSAAAGGLGALGSGIGSAGAGLLSLLGLLI